MGLLPPTPMDFTIRTYKQLLEALNNSSYAFQPFAEFIENPEEKAIVLRHDVDERPQNALKMAQLESELGIRATYYFRIVKISNNPKIIKQIVDLGHEIGYHYEDYSSCNGNINKAIKEFKENLAYFRTYYPVKTVCMHGSSMSDFDNRMIWKFHNLSDFGIIGEPYISIDYSKVFYLTDTGRRWDGNKYSVRDFVNNSFQLSFHRTSDIIKALQSKRLPDQLIIQSHTLWTDSVKEWYWLEFREKLRNNIKIIIIKMPWIKKFAYKLIQFYSK